MSMENEVFTRLSNCEHLMKTNLAVETYEIDEDDATEDIDNPGFTKGWHYFFDIVSNSVISFPGKEIIEKENGFLIQIRLTDEIVAKFETPELIEEFLKKCEMKSRYFSNVSQLSNENKVHKKLGL